MMLGRQATQQLPRNSSSRTQAVAAHTGCQCTCQHLRRPSRQVSNPWRQLQICHSTSGHPDQPDGVEGVQHQAVHSSIPPWLSRLGLWAAFPHVVLWGPAWVLSMGLLHSGYTLTCLLTHLGSGVAQVIGAPITADYTHLAVQAAQHLSSGTLHGPEQLLPWFSKAALLTVWGMWTGLGAVIDILRPGIPGVLFIAQLCVLWCVLVFGATMTPARPVLAAIAARNTVQRRAAAAAPNTTSQPDTGRASREQHNSQAVLKLQANLEHNMRLAGWLSLVVLMTGVQAFETQAPPLGSILRQPGVLGGPPSPAASLFALLAPISDVIIPAVLTGMAALTLLNRQAQESRLYNVMWTRLGAGVCALRCNLDVLLIAAVATGQMPGTISGFRAVGAFLLARTAWRLSTL